MSEGAGTDAPDAETEPNVAPSADASGDAPEDETERTTAADADSEPDAEENPEPAPTGAPAKMAANRAALTPMMTQYLELCERYDDALVLFQVGDFYETFCEAAETAARVLEITLTSREDSSGEYPMAGIPVDSAASYVETLLQAGFRVAIADQVETPAEATGVVERAVTRIVTPGTVVDEELLAAGTTNYVAALTRRDAASTATPKRATDAVEPPTEEADRARVAVAFIDVSTGECRVTGGTEAVVQDELDRYAPAEVVTGPGVDPDRFAVSAMHTPFEDAAFDHEAATERLGAYLGRPERVIDHGVERRAVGGLLAYAEYTQGVEAGGLSAVTRIQRYDPAAAMGVDRTALESLEVFENRAGGTDRTLMGVLDRTACALGRRELDHWLRRPLVDRERIERRHAAVEAFVEHGVARETVREHLRDVYDLERLITRISQGRANARDLRSLQATLDVIPQLRAALADIDSAPVADRRAALDELADVRGLIERAIAPEPPIEVTEGDVIRDGFDDTLDELRATEREGREWVAALEASERERTGIDSLNVGFNEVHGYYIEVTNPNLDRVPDDYTRRQTLKNSERFYTPELKQREDEILAATERADNREYQLFTDVRTTVAEETERIQQVAEVVAELDVLTALAAVAVDRDYVRPQMGAEGVRITAGRHPVVETTTAFVPNDAVLNEQPFAIVTGPNMSGKSTYMRQVALICLLAQIGAFVPADRAALPVLDRIFTRVGASDDIAGGRSTFMREMEELTTILHEATGRSLVLLDEVGRGTSTADGRAIAWAVTEFLHDEVGATTLFATHYHELTRLADRLEGVCNRHFTVDREDGLSFLHSIVEGPSAASYGVDVARMAGVPTSVIDRSRSLLDGLPAASTAGDDAPGADAHGGDDSGDSTSPPNSGPPDEAVQRPERGQNEHTTTRSEPGAGAKADGDGTIDTASTGRSRDASPDRSAEDGDDDAGLPADLAEHLRALRLADTTPMEALLELDRAQRRLGRTDDHDGTDDAPSAPRSVEPTPEDRATTAREYDDD